MPEETTPTQPVQTPPSQPAQTTPTQSAVTIYDPRSTLEQFYTPREVHWVDISEISSFSNQNITGTALMNVGMLVIGLTSLVDTSEGGAVQLKWIAFISGLILFIIGLAFFGASYLITLKEIKKKKKPLPL